MSRLFQRLIVGLPLALLFIFITLYPNGWLFPVFIAFIFFYILIFEWPKFRTTSNLVLWSFMPIYIFIPLIIAIHLHRIDPILIIYLVFSTAINDSGAYFFGKLFGRHKLAPALSPGKTLEGAFGGFLTLLIFNLIFFSKSNIFAVILFTMLLSLTAVIGDLFESYLKRRAGLKDSGHILLDHGGLLDKIDASLFAVFVVFLFKNYVLKHL